MPVFNTLQRFPARLGACWAVPIYLCWLVRVPYAVANMHATREVSHNVGIQSVIFQVVSASATPLEVYRKLRA